MYETILIPTGGSDHAIRAAEHGHYLARRFDATVHVINVVDVQAAAGAFSAGGVGEEFIGRLETEGENTIEAVEAAIGETDSLQTTTVRGKPGEAILEYADGHDADLLAMGTHGRTGINRYIAGSVTERVVRLADCPVLTVRATDRSRVTEDYDEILIPTDGSEPAAAAVEHGLAIAAQTGARVHAVNIVDIGDIAASPEYTPPTAVIEQLESEGEAATERIATQAQDRDLDAVTAVREGLPARDILEYADDADIDLIAMGTAGRTGLNRYLLGSTAERIVRHAEMPVVAVNARDRVR
ncbi:universal stress protein [Halosimplex pelagicum]|uniref:Universal stress protein n=1 Tax=Halosimplex pelagicum TaxID=869886 RepID=A0A7D5PEW9_9EURY|nr:universal stress protein [Halosimplex pelagicum]QLH82099.1 universal stress protein [Halosimplex pelagicum]